MSSPISNWGRSPGLSYHRGICCRAHLQTQYYTECRSGWGERKQGLCLHANWDAYLADLTQITLLLAENPGAWAHTSQPHRQNHHTARWRGAQPSLLPQFTVLSGQLKYSQEGAAWAHSSALSYPCASELQQPIANMQQDALTCAPTKRRWEGGLGFILCNCCKHCLTVFKKWGWGRGKPEQTTFALLALFAYSEQTFRCNHY